ncbi:MAG: group II intron reverse transcriptase/maturase, partial [bacterium]|nr:group II intron reverse transcriptase/maturase [bacterium]
MRQLQRRLWAVAKRQPGRRFHALYDRIYRLDVLWSAWSRVRSNGGSAGVDKQTLEEIERYGVKRFVEELHEQLRTGEYRCQVVLRRYIVR